MQGYGGVGPGGFGGRGPPMPPRPFDPSLLKRPRDDALYGGLGMGGGDEGRGWEGGDFKRLATGLGGAEGQEEESPYAVSLLVPCDAVGHLIGKGGIIRLQIAQESGAKVKVQDFTDLREGSRERGITVSGTWESVERAQHIILEKLQQRKAARKLATVMELEGPIINADGTVVKEEDRVMLRWLVPNESCGLLIGKKGATIQGINQESGARVKMGQEDEMPPGSVERVVHVIGTKDTTDKALQMIREKVGGRLFEPLHGDTMMVPLSAIASILGPSGATIRAIRDSSGARVHVTNLTDTEIGNTESKIDLDGTPEQIKLAKEILFQRLTDWQNEWRAKGQDPDNKANTTIKMSIPSPLIGHLIGKGGVFVKELLKTGALVRILQEEKSHTKTFDERPVLLTGPTKAVFQAQKSLCERMMKAPPRLLEQIRPLSQMVDPGPGLGLGPGPMMPPFPPGPGGMMMPPMGPGGGPMGPGGGPMGGPPPPPPPPPPMGFPPVPPGPPPRPPLPPPPSSSSYYGQPGKLGGAGGGGAGGGGVGAGGAGGPGGGGAGAGAGRGSGVPSPPRQMEQAQQILSSYGINLQDLIGPNGSRGPGSGNNRPLISSGGAPNAPRGPPLPSSSTRWSSPSRQPQAPAAPDYSSYDPAVAASYGSNTTSTSSNTQTGTYGSTSSNAQTGAYGGGSTNTQSGPYGSTTSQTGAYGSGNTNTNTQSGAYGTNASSNAQSGAYGSGTTNTQTGAYGAGTAGYYGNQASQYGNTYGANPYDAYAQAPTATQANPYQYPFNATGGYQQGGVNNAANYYQQQAQGGGQGTYPFY